MVQGNRVLNSSGWHRQGFIQKGVSIEGLGASGFGCLLGVWLCVWVYPFYCPRSGGGVGFKFRVYGCGLKFRV